jgi:hypothetical protein
MDREKLSEIKKQALERLGKRNKVTDLRLAQALVDEDPTTGGKVFLLGAVAGNNPDKVFETVVNENGEDVDVKALSERAGRALFDADRRPIRWYFYRYSYSVKIVCGTQEVADGCCCLPAVRPGIYSTEVNIHNYHPYRTTWISKSVLPVVFAGMPVGREPRTVGRRAYDEILLPPDSATMDDCCRIGELLYESAPPAGNPLTVGFLEIVSDIELKVTAVYTATDAESRSVSIDVEDIAARTKGPFYWWPWIAAEPGIVVPTPTRGAQ